MAVCGNCGAQLKGGEVICPKCGAGITWNCGTCGAPIEGGADFCPKCGTRIIWNADETGQTNSGNTQSLKDTIINSLIGLGWYGIVFGVIVGLIGGCYYFLDKTGDVPDTMETVTVERMLADLGENEIKAQKKYADNWFEIVGRLGSMDSDGDYFSLDGEVISVIRVLCDIPMDRKDELTNKLTKMKKGERIAVKAKVTDMGEIMGYKVKVADIYKKP